MPVKKSFLFTHHNQLFIKPDREGKLQPLKGNFKISPDNNLVYLAEEPSGWSREYNYPEQLEFRGKWRFNSDYDLVLELSDNNNFGKGSLILKGEIVECQKDALIFQIKTQRSDYLETISLLKLKGNWQADSFNQLVFEVTKKSTPDALTFKGQWNINQSQQIIYTLERADLKTKTKSSYTLTLEGFWQINEKNRLTYIISGGNESILNFRVQAESPHIYPKEGTMRYRLGMGAGKERGDKIITLYGTWKFSRLLGLEFEMSYGNSRIKALELSAALNLNEKTKVIFDLKGKGDKPLGIALTVNRNLLPKKDLDYFLKLKSEGKNLYLGIGTTLRF